MAPKIKPEDVKWLARRKALEAEALAEVEKQKKKATQPARLSQPARRPAANKAASPARLSQPARKTPQPPKAAVVFTGLMADGKTPAPSFRKWCEERRRLGLPVGGLMTVKMALPGAFFIGGGGRVELK
ncbi:MAG TPA: hypothetical protein PKE55_00795 [Kiritimatiellia bacterium]|nr:hypothetical protein [Kiritimatiellia bacterium]